MRAYLKKTEEDTLQLKVKKKLWSGEFWSDGYFASTVGKHGDEAMIGKYVKGQGGKAARNK